MCLKQKENKLSKIKFCMDLIVVHYSTIKSTICIGNTRAVESAQQTIPLQLMKF